MTNTDMESAKRGVITIGDAEIEVRHPKSVATIQWADIDRVLADKRDLLTTDLICLLLCNADATQSVEPNEEMQGFAELREELERRLPGFREAYEEWFSKSPAFDGNPSVIWRRGHGVC